MEQRLVGLSFTAKPGELSATAPASGNLAPPGYYLLFVLSPERRAVRGSTRAPTDDFVLVTAITPPQLDLYEASGF